MDVELYKENISFRRLKNDYVSSECPICYLHIDSTQNIVFGCLHNSCSGCLLAHLKSSLKKENVPVCFLCRSPLCVFDSRDRDLKREMYALLRNDDDGKEELDLSLPIHEDGWDGERDFENMFFLEHPERMIMVQNREPIDRVYIVRTFNIIRGYENVKDMGRSIFYGLLVWGLSIFFNCIFYNNEY